MVLLKSNRQDGYVDPLPDAIFRDGVSVIILVLVMLLALMVGCATEPTTAPADTTADEVTVSEKMNHGRGMSPLVDTIDKPDGCVANFNKDGSPLPDTIDAPLDY